METQRCRSAEEVTRCVTPFTLVLFFGIVLVFSSFLGADRSSIRSCRHEFGRFPGSSSNRYVRPKIWSSGAIPLRCLAGQGGMSISRDELGREARASDAIASPRAKEVCCNDGADKIVIVGFVA